MKGTHGTFRKNVESIRKSGFWVNGEGARCGKGAYFWDYENQNYRDEAFVLAKAHWKQSFKIGKCSNDEGNDCVVYDVEFEDSMFMVDTLEKEVRERLQILLSQHEEKFSQGTHPVDYSRLNGIYDYFIEIVERQLDRVVHAMRFTVHVDKRFFPIRYVYLNDPTCVVVKEPDTVVNVLEINLVDMLNELCVN